MIQFLIPTIMFCAGFIVGRIVADKKASKGSINGFFTLEELEDAPGYGKIHINFDGTMLDKDTTDKIILHRTDSPE